MKRIPLGGRSGPVVLRCGPASFRRDARGDPPAGQRPGGGAVPVLPAVHPQPRGERPGAGLAGAVGRAAGVPAAAMVEALDAFGAAIDLERELRDGDRFYVRYERTFTAAGRRRSAPAACCGPSCAPRPRAPRRSIASGRSRPAADSFWLSTGQAATPAGDQAAARQRHRVVGLRHARRSVRPADARRRPAAGAARSRRRARSPHAAGPSRRPRRWPTKPLGGPPPQPSPFTNPTSLRQRADVGRPRSGALVARLQCLPGTSASRAGRRCSCTRASTSRPTSARRSMPRATAWSRAPS